MGIGFQREMKIEFGQKINSHSWIHVLEYSSCCPPPIGPGLGANSGLWISPRTYTSKI